MVISIDFSGQVVLVTGAAPDLGLAIATAFGQAGAAIALNDISPHRVDRAAMELSQLGIVCHGFAADVRDAHSILPSISL